MATVVAGMTDQISGMLPQFLTGHLDMLAAALDSVESRSLDLGSKLAAANAQSQQFRSSLREATEEVQQLQMELRAARNREQLLEQELQASRLQGELVAEQLRMQLTEELQRADRLRTVREEVLLQRDDALLELANAYADIDAMQATLADSAAYVQQLRRRILELELKHDSAAAAAAAAVASAAAHRSRDQQRDTGPFSLASISASITKAVQEAGSCDAEERKKRIRQLQLRWHPDKNVVLKEFATEVSKIINEAVAALGDPDT